MGDMASRVRSLGGLVLRCHGSGCVHSEIKKRFKMEKFEALRGAVAKYTRLFQK